MSFCLQFFLQISKSKIVCCKISLHHSVNKDCKKNLCAQNEQDKKTYTRFSKGEIFFKLNCITLKLIMLFRFVSVSTVFCRTQHKRFYLSSRCKHLLLLRFFPRSHACMHIISRSVLFCMKLYVYSVCSFQSPDLVSSPPPLPC